MKLNAKQSVSCSTSLRFSVIQIFMLLLIALSVLMAAAESSGQTFTILHRFDGSDGSGPYSRLTRDGAGNLYGTTAGGGTYGGGTVFKLDSAGNETVLHSFVGGHSDGVEPVAGVIRDPRGNLYGTTIYGGVVGCGVVYKVDTAGMYSVLHNFAGGDEGCLLYGMLAQDSAGNLYGTTHVGGTHGWGTVFKLDPHGHETVLHNFMRRTDGRYPDYGVTRDSAGNLYGSTWSGGAFECGTLFTMNSAGKITRLITLTTLDSPDSRPVRDAAGNLYGTTAAGGSNGGGTIYKIDAYGHKTVLYNFGADGGYGPYGGLSRDAGGNLYGTLTWGGVNQLGVVYKLDSSLVYTELYVFSGVYSDGWGPAGGVALDVNGNLYGTAQVGGDPCGGGGSGCGTVFEITP